MALSKCGTKVANTGELACDFSKGVLKKIFIFNGSVDEADRADAATLFARLVANAKLSKSASNKIFPIPEAQDIADNSEANTEGTLGLGFKMVLREGKPAYTIKILAGSDLYKRLRTFNNQTLRVLEFDANGIIWGTTKGGKFMGYQVQLFFSGGKAATGQNVEEKVVTITMSVMSNSEYMDNSYGMNISEFNIEDILPLLDANLVNISNSSNVYKIGVHVPTADLSGDYNLHSDFGAALASLNGSFSAGTGTNFGTSLAITSIAADDTLECLTVTFDSTAYTALSAGAKIRLNPPTVAQLDAGDVPGIEIIPVILTK